MIKTIDLFKKDIEELTTIEENFCTVEENMLSELGEEVIFFDDIQEKEEDMNELNHYLKKKGLKVDKEYVTLNGRIAVILNRA